MESVSCTTRPDRSVVEARFRAMGSDAHVVVTGPDGETHLAAARRRIDDLERRWSRFLPESEISLANRLAGTGDAVRLSGDTVALLERADLAWSTTGGVWNPLLGGALVELGYRRSFEHGIEAADLPEPRRAAGFDVVDFDPLGRSLSLPADVALDLGGIGKGLAADLVTEELLAAGAWGALVSLGGDLRVRGMSPTGLDWGVSVGEPALGRAELTTIRLVEGAVATSTTARRCWQAEGRSLHHLVDPRTSLPAKTDITLTTSVAGSAWWAEVCATALTIDPTLELPAQEALQIRVDDTVGRSPGFARYET